MRIIISPARKMKVDLDNIPYQDLPKFFLKTEELLECLKQKSYEEIKKIWNCNDKIADYYYKYLKTIKLTKNLTPALLCYDGIQYQYMAPFVFETEQWDYVKEHVRILSAFYGILKPMDGILPYRLEMQSKIELNGYQNLYEFWGNTLYQTLKEETDCILNLASKEYAKCIENYIEKNVRMITCIFGQLKEKKIVQKGTLAKMARGEMVRFLAEQKIENLEEIKNFKRLNYCFDYKRSTEDKFIFLQ